MKIFIKLLDSNSEIYKKILTGLLPQIDKYMNRAVKDIQSNISPIIQSAIRNSPEYESILLGQLKYELGIPNPAINLEGLINIWTNSIEFSYNRPIISNNKIKSSFSVNMIRADFSDVLSTDFAIVVDTVRGYDLPWLKWLLLDGTKTIVQDYEVLFGQNNASRTGFAIMTPSNRSWKVPSQYSGTISDNWITRAIDDASPQIQDVLDRAFQL
jgi:hypothetical protein